MSLDVTLTRSQPTEVYSANITHNLTDMAKAAGIYEYLWRPDEAGATHAVDLIAPLRKAVYLMKEDPELFEVFDSENGWGTYKDFLPWIEKYLAACIANPNATIKVSR